MEDVELSKMSLVVKRLETKIKSAESRMDELEAERLEMQLWAQEIYMKENGHCMQPGEFRRKQSALFNKLNPDAVSMLY